MTFTFRKAERSHTPIFFGIAGPSGSGKTYSALRFATGLAQGGKIFFIDTESGRGRQYADKFDYLYSEMGAPFEPGRYMDAINAAKDAGARVVIIDSTSHMHEGPGGMLEQHERTLDQKAGSDFGKRERMNFSAWIEPKREFNKFVNRLLQLGDEMHVVFCFRAKEKLKLNKKTKYEIPREWEPITPTGFEYEMTALLMPPPKADGIPDLSIPATKLIEPHRGIIPKGRPIDEEMGKFFADWSRGTGKKVRAADSPPPNGASTAETERVDSAQQPGELPGMDDDAGIPEKTFQWLLATSMQAETKADFEKWSNKAKIAAALADMNADQRAKWVRHEVELESRWAAAAAGELDDMPPPSEPADAGPEMGYTGAAG